MTAPLPHRADRNLAEGTTLAVSLGEADALARRAARGAGYPVGLAEEAGIAVRFLMRWGVEPLAPLAATLTALAGRHADHRAVLDGTTLAAPTVPLCPIATGAAVADLRSAAPLTAKRVLHPILALPALAMAARGSGGAFALDGLGAPLIVGADGPDCAVTPLHEATLTVRCLATPPEPAAVAGVAPRRAVDAAAWRTLGHLAARTVVPASAASRAHGAGAGLTDND